MPYSGIQPEAKSIHGAILAESVNERRTASGQQSLHLITHLVKTTSLHKGRCLQIHCSVSHAQGLQLHCLDVFLFHKKAQLGKRSLSWQERGATYCKRHRQAQRCYVQWRPGLLRLPLHSCSYKGSVGSAHQTQQLRPHTAASVCRTAYGY